MCYSTAIDSQGQVFTAMDQLTTSGLSHPNDLQADLGRFFYAYMNATTKMTAAL